MKIKTIAISSLILFALSSTVYGDNLVVIVHPDNPLPSITKDDISAIYLGKKNTFEHGGNVKAYDLSKNHEMKKLTYKSIVQKSGAQLKSYWARMTFTGRAKPPAELSSTEEMKKIIGKSENAIGYINASSVDASVKVVYTLE